MLFDTHCHLNFKTFDNQHEAVVKRAQAAGVNEIVIPGTNYETSLKAVEIANAFENVYAAAAIHPHHIFEMIEKKDEIDQKKALNEIESLLTDPKVVAVGEVGLDRHMYKKTKYRDYKVEEEFVNTQKRFLEEQIVLAAKYKKSLILHNREAKNDFLGLLAGCWDKDLEYKTVFHCCEPDLELLEFALAHKVFIGVDGDVVYTPDKQEFIKKVPLDMLVLETDSPFLSPDRKFPNEPKNIAFIAKIIANIKSKTKEDIAKATTSNARRLFSI
jgi:TatD DNase family protein